MPQKLRLPKFIFYICTAGALISTAGALISTADALTKGSPGDPTNHPLIAFEHLSLYIQKHLGQSVAVCGILWKGRSWQTKVQTGIAGHSQVKPGSQVQPRTVLNRPKWHKRHPDP